MKLLFRSDDDRKGRQTYPRDEKIRVRIEGVLYCSNGQIFRTRVVLLRDSHLKVGELLRAKTVSTKDAFLIENRVYLPVGQPRNDASQNDKLSINLLAFLIVLVRFIPSPTGIAVVCKRCCHLYRFIINYLYRCAY